MNININATQFELLFNEVVFSLCMMSLVMVFNIYFFVEISLGYRRTLQRSALRGRHYEMLRFVAFIMLIVVAMLLSLSLWVFALTIFDFLPDWVSALLFTASFYTSVGNFAVSLPVGWRLVPSIIAFTGLFSFAWATACSMAMARELTQHLAKHKQI